MLPCEPDCDPDCEPPWDEPLIDPLLDCCELPVWPPEDDAPPPWLPLWLLE